MKTISNEGFENEYYSIQKISKIFDITDGFTCHILFMLNLLIKSGEGYIANDIAVRNKLIIYSKKKKTFYISKSVFNDFNHHLKIYKKNSIRKNYKK